MDLSTQPYLVVEKSELGGDRILASAKEKKIGKRRIQALKKNTVCIDRLVISVPRIYVLEPSATQVGCLFQRWKQNTDHANDVYLPGVSRGQHE